MSSLLAGTVHELPDDLAALLRDDSNANDAWQSLTPLARNEFICWVNSPKQDATRKKRIQRTIEELREGKRRPCCWIGCIHREDKAISPSVRGILARKNNSSKK